MGLILFFLNQISLSQGFIVSSLVEFEPVVRKKIESFNSLMTDRRTARRQIKRDRKTSCF